MFLYETHMHTSPVSRCAHQSVRENLEFYKEMGFRGVFITNHFLDGNIAIDRDKSYEERIRFFCSDYEEGVKIGKEIGIDVFFGVEMSYGGTDFLVYGLDKEWYLAHPEIMEMKYSDRLRFLREQEHSLVIHAHPFREAGYIDHIRLFPRAIDGVEVINACRTPFENEMAKQYAKNYGFLEVAGSDNHNGRNQKALAGIMTEEPLTSELDYVRLVKENKIQIKEMTL